MYKVNNISLEDYGIIAARAPGSNLALEGFLGMPARLGKAYHNWGDEAGVEPYVTAEDIFYGGRTLNFYGVMDTDSKADAIQAKKDLYALFATFTDLVPLETTWGTYQVYCKEGIEVEYLGQGKALVKIPFREPVVANPAALPTGTELVKYNIDGVSFEQLGAFVVKVENNFDRPKTKEEKITAYGMEGYQVTKAQADTVQVTTAFTADGYTNLKNNVQRLHKLLSMPDTRTMNVDGTQRVCFNVDGFTVGKIRVWGNLAICELQFTMLMALDIQQAGIFQFMQTNSGEDIVTNDSENIEVI